MTNRPSLLQTWWNNLNKGASPSQTKHVHQYKQGITFDRVLRLYRFDKKLRVMLFNEIEKIEVAFRAAIVNTVTDMTGDIFWMTNPSYVNAGTLTLI